MFQQTEIENSLWGVADELIAEPEIKTQCEILEGVVRQYGFVVRPGIKAKMKTTIYAFYDPKATNLKRQLVLVLGQRKTITENKLHARNVGRFLFDINCAVQHELIHKYQWLHRDLETYESQYAFHKSEGKSSHHLYLGSLDEIETHAHDAAMEIRYHYPEVRGEEVVRDYFNQVNGRSLPTFNYYNKTFGRFGKNEQFDGVFRALIKKTFLWLPKVAIIRPVTYKYRSGRCQN